MATTDDAHADDTRVAVDTSALMLPVEGSIRVFDELDRLLGTYRAVVPRSVVAELNALAGGNGEAARAAAVGRDLVDRCAVVETDNGYADDAIAALARRTVTHVVTNDRPLADRVRTNVRPITVRGRGRLTIESCTSESD
ncbi:twitching motility protein PilT [Halobacteriales archaeon SW_7_68_16]|nr:MAG: twitching motility protein PilT [Halobacteriales archaeon SW_7_68_16]